MARFRRAAASSGQSASPRQRGGVLDERPASRAERRGERRNDTAVAAVEGKAARREAGCDLADRSHRDAIAANEGKRRDFQPWKELLEHCRRNELDTAAVERDALSEAVERCGSFEEPLKA